MILIDLEKHNTKFVGSISELTTEYIVLTHSFIDSVMKRLPPEPRKAFKDAMAAAFLGELGLDVLEELGLIGGTTMIDASELTKLMKEDGGHEANG